jgi:endonuclease/exonuclease/phosphatase family metal-dependent hydrolase
VTPPVAPQALPTLSAEDRAALAAVRRRADLEASDLWRRLGPTVTAITEGTVHRRPAAPAARPTDRRFLRVLAWNLLRGTELDAALHLLTEDPRLADLDLLLLNEVDLGCARSANRDVAAEIADALGFEQVFGNSYVVLNAGDAHERKVFGDAPNAVGLHGNAVLARDPIVAADNVAVHVTRDKFHSSEKRLGQKRALSVTVRTPLGDLPVANAHLDSIASPADRARQLSDLLAALPSDGPALLGGDLNTTTYDLANPLRLTLNLLAKLWRGGFPHALHSYLHPWERYERPVFRTLEQAGFAWRAFNALGQGTIRYAVGDAQNESTLAEHVPGVFARFLRWRLRPWDGVAPLRTDWFAARGLRALRDAEMVEPSGRASQRPRSVTAPTWQGRAPSDHDPVLVDVTLA